MKQSDRTTQYVLVAAGLLIAGIGGWNWLNRHEPGELSITQPAEPLAESVDKEASPLADEAPADAPTEPITKTSLRLGSRDELLAIPGMTKEAVDEIIRLRKGYGPIFNNEELLKLPGITQERLDQMIPHIAP